MRLRWQLVLACVLVGGLLLAGPAQARQLDRGCFYRGTCTTIFTQGGRVKFRVKTGSFVGRPHGYIYSVCVKRVYRYPSRCREGLRLRRHGHHKFVSDKLDFFRAFPKFSRKAGVFQMWWTHGGGVQTGARPLLFKCSSNHLHCRSARR